MKTNEKLKTTHAYEYMKSEWHLRGAQQIYEYVSNNQSKPSNKSFYSSLCLYNGPHGY